MAVTTSTRVGVTLWSSDSDQFSRAQMQASHTAIEANAAIYSQAAIGSRPTAGKLGRFFWATDETKLYYDNGSAWTVVGTGVFLPLSGGTLSGALAVATSVTITGGSVIAATTATIGSGTVSAAVTAGAGTHSLALGRRDGTSSSPAINLNSSGNNQAYDVRLFASGGDGSVGNGSLTINAAGGVSINGGTTWHSGNDGTGSGLDADLLDGQESTVFATKTGTETLTNKTLTTPTINSGVVVTPTIASFTNATHDHSNAAGGGNIPQTSVTGLLASLSSKADGSTVTAHTGASTEVHGITGAVVGTTDTQTLAAKTLTTPVIGSFTNATHDHSNAAGGGNIPEASVTGLVSDLAAKATTATVSGHTGASTGVHGATGAVVGTTDTQTLTNKTIDGTSNTIRNVPAGTLTGFAGMVIPFAGTSAPSGYLMCDGSAVSRSTYATLFAVVSTTYGSGDGTTTFNLPNLKGRVPVGFDASQTEFDSLGENGGEKTHTLTTAEMPSHNHGGAVTGTGTHIHTIRNGSADTNKNVSSGSVALSNASAYTTASSEGGHAHGISAQGDGTAHNILQPYIALNYVIKV